jgi:nucleoid DNA-binding protein
MAIVNKDELVRGIAERSGLGVGEAKAALEATLDEISGQLKVGNEVRLTGFGKFWVSHRPARKGRNPQTGEPIEIHARAVPKLSPGAGLKQAVQ